MADMKRVVIDAGHGGADPGAVYYGRQEKDDTLNLALAVGEILSRNGVEVSYTRVSDIYNTPLEKAQMANNAEADYFVSIHRNAANVPGSASGSLALVYEMGGAAELLARNINEELEKTGFTDLGISERPGIIVLRKTEMPAVLVEAGFIDNPEDNRFFDRNFQAIAEAIANGVLTTVKEEEASEPEFYQIQVGAYQNQELAQQLLTQLESQGFPAWMKYDDGLYRVRVGAFLNLDNAARMEQTLRAYGYNTFMVKDTESR